MLFSFSSSLSLLKVPNNKSKTDSCFHFMRFYSDYRTLVFSPDIYEFATPRTGVISPEPNMALREMFRFSKDYSSTEIALTAKPTPATQANGYSGFEDVSSVGSHCNSTINTSLEELEFPENFELDDSRLDATEWQKTEAASTDDEKKKTVAETR